MSMVVLIIGIKEVGKGQKNDANTHVCIHKYMYVHVHVFNRGFEY